jgi:integrase
MDGGMAKLAAELGALHVKRLSVQGMHTVGGVPGLYLNVTATGTKSWILRLTVAGKRHELGLGPFPEVSLADARLESLRLRQQVRAGENPVAERVDARAAKSIVAKPVMTFSAATDEYLSSTRAQEFTNAKHAKQWPSTLTKFAFPIIGNKPVDQIERADIMQILQPIWLDKTETAKRLRGRIENVLAWATVAGHRTGENPARWSGNLQQLLPAPSKVAKTTHHPALSLKDAPAWFEALRLRDGVSAIALQFLAITATRSGEIRGAVWQEIDLPSKVWTIPADRMKMAREHRIPLGPAAVKLLTELPRQAGTDLIFPGQSQKQMSDMTLSAVMRRMQDSEKQSDRKGWIDPVSGRAAVPHGLRSTFRDWVAEKTDFPSDMAEIALAHKVGSDVQLAYRRGDMIDRRRAMMEAWEMFLLSKLRR